MKWLNKDKTIFVQTEAIEFFRFHHANDDGPPRLVITVYGSQQIIFGDEAVNLYNFLIKELDKEK